MKDSRSLASFLESLADPKQTIAMTKRDIKRPEKLLKLGILEQYLAECGGKSSLEEFLKTKAGISQHLDALSKSELFSDVLEKFRNCFKNKIEFNPSAGVIGAVASQEIIKVITRKDNPGIGLFLYDVNSQKIIIEK